MSRIGKQPVSIPSGVKVKVANGKVFVEGPKGKLEMPYHRNVTVEVGKLGKDKDDNVTFTPDPNGSVIRVARRDEERLSRAVHGLMRTLVANMVQGVTEGFVKELEIIGVGYRATAQGPKNLELALGSSHPVRVAAPDGIEFDVPAPTRVVVRGIDKEKVGQVAADIRKIRKPEPYKGKGVRYAGERIIRKAGKAAK